MKKFAVLVIFVVIYSLGSINIYAGSNTQSLNNFVKIRDHEDSFTDISSTDWFYSRVLTAYSYGIINGMGNNLFSPKNSLSCAEALTLAAKTHAVYFYGTNGDSKIDEYNYENDSSWYGKYVRYCKDHNLIENEFDNILSQPITRAQMVFAWSKLLSDADMEEQNVVISLPDVNNSTEYHAEIFAFYHAGILSGTDEQGTFKPDDKITRAEASAIFMNLIDKSLRASSHTFFQTEKV